MENRAHQAPKSVVRRESKHINMNDPLENLMADKTDKELEGYLINVKQHTAAEITAALSELQQRGKEPNSMQLAYLNQIIRRKLIDEDPNVAVYYSKQSLFTFSILFSVLAASILLSLNLKDKREKWVIIGFGITYTVFMVTTVSQFSNNILIPFGFNALGGAVLQTFFWNRYIGKDTLYKRKSLLIPTLVAIAICIPLIVLSIYAQP
jgi:hypothetical protein